MKRVAVTMHDVGRLAGVSQTTVSLILNQGKQASFPQETINRVYAAAAQLNYKPKHTSAKKDSSNNILVLMANVNNPYYTAMLSSIEDVCYSNQISAVSCCTYHNGKIEKNYMEMAIKQHYLGVILLSPPDNVSSFAELSSHLPVVTICDRNSNLKADTDIIELNNYTAGQIAARHLHTLGHKHIAVLTSSLERNTARIERLNGIKNFFEQNLPDSNLILCIESNSESDVLAERLNDYHAGRFLAKNEQLYQHEITALICMNDMLAYGVIDSLKEEGISVPNDVSVLGFDNLFYSKLSGISLTTVDQHTELLAKSAVEVLLQKVKTPQSVTSISGIHPRFKVECQPSLVVRGSTAPPPSTRKTVSRDK